MTTLQCAQVLVCCLQQLSTVLKGRLTLKNAHKQWLALELVQEVSRQPCLELFRADTVGVTTLARTGLELVQYIHMQK